MAQRSALGAAVGFTAGACLLGGQAFVSFQSARQSISNASAPALRGAPQRQQTSAAGSSAALAAPAAIAVAAAALGSKRGGRANKLATASVVPVQTPRSSVARKALQVNVISASNLADDDGPFNGSDPYVYVTLDGCEPQRTATVGGTSDPEWNEVLTFEDVTEPASKVMKLRVYDDDWGRDDNIGECSLDLGTLQATSDPQEFELVVDDGIFTDAKLKFEVTTDGSWGNPVGGSGTLRVMVHACAGLDDADFAGTTDPYAYLTIDGCEPQQTDKKEGTINPEWEQELVFEGIENPLSKTLNIKIYDDDTFSRDDKIGECEVDLAELKMGEGSKDFEKGVDWSLFGLVKTATITFTLSWEEWGDLP